MYARRWKTCCPPWSCRGGVYNFGSENTLTMYETARAFCTALHISPALEPGDRQRSLAMDCAKARRGGVVFDTTAEGIRRCLRDYGLDTPG